MTNKRYRSGNEAFTFVDRVTGREVHQLTNSNERSVHSYYDIPPWSPKTGQIVLSSMRPNAGEADIYVMDRDGDNITYLAHSRAVSANDGAMAQWSFDGRRVYFKDRDGDQRLIAWVDIETGEKGALPGDLRMMSPSRNMNAYHTVCRDYPDHEIIRRREEHGLFVQDLDRGETRRLASVADCWRIHPRRDEIDHWHLYIKHSKWSRDGQRIMFVFTNEIRYAPKYAELPRVKDVYVVNAAGTGLKRVGEFGNHPLWHPNGREILTNSPFEGRPGNSLVLTNVDTGEQRLASASIGGSGHPSFSPDETRIAVDHVLNREGYGSINLVHVETDTVEHLVEVNVIDHSHIGTHLHPVWSRDGTQILYASDASGIAQLCVVDVG
jgi:Tol biopolymer transport system component